MLNQQSYLSPGDDDMLFDDTTPITFGENKKSNCKMNKNDLPIQYPNGKFLNFKKKKIIKFFVF
jgi:hypothetical protein